MPAKIRIIRIVLAALTLAGCTSEGLQRTVYEAASNMGRQQCMGDPGRDPANCNELRNYSDYRSRRDARVE
jgi:hypothetical protein